MAIGGFLAAWDLLTGRRGQTGGSSERRAHEVREHIVENDLSPDCLAKSGGSGARRAV
jgi:hypothetical protein